MVLSPFQGKHYSLLHCCPVAVFQAYCLRSRIDGNGYDAAEYARHRSRSGSTDPRHLTGEMIRQMNALQKKGSGNASAAAVAAASMAYQHQMQMHATYERVLKV
jgi:hypothetical protein